MTNTADKSDITETLDKVPPHGMKQEMTPEPALSAGLVLFIAGAILATALLVTAGLSVWSWWRRRKQKSAISPWGSDPSAWERLLEAVEGIKVPEVIGDSKELTATSRQEWNHFTSEVSLCLRRALEIKTGKPFVERTTDEIKQWARQGLDLRGVMDDREFLVFLDSLDRVRFGGDVLSEIEARAMLQSLRAWIARLEHGADLRNTETGEELKVAAPVKLETDAKGGLRVFDT